MTDKKIQLKRTICLVVLLITSCALTPECKLYAQESKNGVFHNKGYLIFFDEFLLFIPDATPSSNISFSKMEKEKGKLIRGVEGFIRQKALSKAKDYKVKEYHINENKEEYRYWTDYYIVPAVIKYVSQDPVNMSDLQLYFNYSGVDYLLKYEDHVDIGLVDIDIIR